MQASHRSRSSLQSYMWRCCPFMPPLGPPLRPQHWTSVVFWKYGSSMIIHSWYSLHNISSGLSSCLRAGSRWVYSIPQHSMPSLHSRTASPSFSVYGLARPMNRGYRQVVRTVCWLAIHARKRSKPNPYPPWGEVPYLKFYMLDSDSF